jgi:general secretion pathway protein G
VGKSNLVLRKSARGSSRNASGFTLVELLIIMVILGILAATVIFALSGTVSSAAVSSCNTDVKTLETALEAFHNNPNNTADSGNYPNASAGTPSGNSQLLAPASSNYGGPYLRAWPGSSHYTITLGGSGHVLVDGKDYDGSATNPCSTVS